MKKWVVGILAVLMATALISSVSAANLQEAVSEAFEYTQASEAMTELEKNWTLAAAEGSEFGSEFFNINAEKQLFMNGNSAMRYNKALVGAYELSYDYNYRRKSQRPSVAAPWESE